MPNPMSALDFRASGFQACSKAGLVPTGRALAYTAGEEMRLLSTPNLFQVL